MVLVTWAGLAGLVACAQRESDGSSASPPVFGGRTALVAEGPRSAGAPEAAGGSACRAASAPSVLALLDDFEDGDSHLFKGFERDGYWYAKADGTDRAKLSPPENHFAPERLPSTERSLANLFAAHFQASGQRDWGAVWGTTLQWENKGIVCPLNASAFVGLRFRAKGPGTMRVNLAMPETQATDSGGTCTSGCYDFHGRVVFLADEWTAYFVPWGRLQQGGWGAEVRFDPARIIGLNFAVTPHDLPADFWIDDIAFVTEEEAPALLAAEHAPPGASAQIAR
jgi:hypothetical protein